MDAQTQKLFKSLCEKRQELANALMQYAARGVWAALIDKYSDSAHFIYELLQNADDANATKVEIFLKKDGLYFKHNGTIRFTISDVLTEEADDKKGRKGHLNALTSIGSSGKPEDLEKNKIGKFGIGFKSVFQYTQTPEVFDDVVSFRLNNYIVPELLTTDHQWRKKGETLFYLPFNKKAKSSKNAYAEIEEKLKTLDNPILFLNHLKEISWNTETKSSEGLYSKEIVRSHMNGDIQCELMSISNYAKQKSDSIWVFTRRLKLNEGTFPISVGYYLDEDGKINTKIHPNIYCYFPTKKNLNFCFVMHGPFALIENRESMKENEAVNHTIFESLAKLSADALLCLRDIGVKDSKFLINDNIFEIAPLTKYGFGGTDAKWHNYFYDAFLDILRNQEIHLSTSGSYIMSSKAIKADNNLRRLLPKEQLSDLLYYYEYDRCYYYMTPSHVQYDYVHPNVALKRSDNLERYFKNIAIDTFYLDDFGRKFTKDFIKKQPDEWLNSFYKYLSQDGKRLVTFEEENEDDLVYGALLDKPIIRDIDGDFVPLFYDGEACVYILEGERLPNITYIDPELLTNKYLVSILDKLDIATPCTTDIVENVIFPRYENDNENKNIDDNQYQNDFLTILTAFDFNKAQYFIDKIQKHFPFRVHRGCFTKYKYIIYADTERIHSLIGSDDTINIIDTKYYKKITPSTQHGLMSEFFTAMKFYEYLRVFKTENDDIRPYLSTQEIMAIDGVCCIYEWANGKYLKKYYLSEARVCDYILESFEKFSKDDEISKEYSLFVWESLCQYNIDYYSFKEYLQASIYYLPYNNHKYNKKCRCKESTFVKQIRERAWLYNKEGKLCKAENIYIEDLDAAYQENHSLYALLGLQHSPQEQDWKFVQENCSEVTQGDLRLGQALRKRGINVDDEEELNEFATEFAKHKRQKAEAERIRMQREEEKANLEKLKKEQKEDLPRHTQTDYSQSKLFDKPADNPTTTPHHKSDISLVLSDEEIAERQEQENIRRSLIEVAEDESKKYTFEWFNALLELEFEASDESLKSSRGINLVFSKVEKDPNSERGVLLRNPSRYIPRSLEEMENISVTFYLPDNMHMTISFEVASVQDYVLRLKCKNEDIEQISDLLQVAHRIYRAEIKTSSPIKLISELQTAFRALNFEDDYSLLDNINSEIKFVFGPPGTGKTTHLVKKWINKVATSPHAKMLILCPTNKAADVIAQRALDNINAKACPENWLYRFVATADEALETHVCTRDSNLHKQQKCCIISTIARFAYDGFEGAKLKDIDWDYIIIDEASMIPLAEIIYPIFRCKKSQIVIAGDPFQIEPIVNEERWKDENIYKMVRLNNFSNPKTAPVQFDIVNLPVQYRAVPAIGRLFSEYAYNGGVSSNRKQESQRKLTIKNYDVKSVNFVMFPVDNFSIFEPHNIGNSPIHIYSALFTFEFVKFIAKNIDGMQDEKLWRIGVISPYRAQAEIINKLWEQRTELYSNVDVSIGTVHGFQGDECDIIVAVYNPPVYGLKRAADRTFVNKKNILNVAISRAQDYLFILMPDREFEHYDKLEAKTIGYIAEKEANEMTTITSQKLEKIMFGDIHHLDKNTFVTMHQLANVYSEPSSKYEVRFDEKSVDIQINDKLR